MNTVLDGRYRIIKKLGKGGFGCTYLAQNLSMPEMPNCVIKHLKPRILHPSVLQLFRTEAKVLDRLDHQQIPNSTDCFEKNGEIFLVQDFIDGDDLGKECLRGKKWLESEIRFFLHDLLEVLQYVHQHNIVHRDIKPDNIIHRKDNGRFVLIDFGAVHEVKSEDPDTLEKSEVIVGTAGYRSPEQLRGESCFSSDIYGLGVTAIQLLTRVHPQYLPSIDQKLVWKDQAMISNELATIIDRMICPQLADRYHSAAEVMAALDSLPPLKEKATFIQERETAPNQGMPLKIFIGALIGLSVFGTTWISLTNQSAHNSTKVHQTHP